MAKINVPVILDNWLYLLGQLNMERGVHGRNLMTHRGVVCQPSTLMFMSDNGFIHSTRGGYRLRRPLTDIAFSELVNQWSLSDQSYARRLLLQYGHLSVETVNRLPALNKTKYHTSVDSVCHVVKALSPDTFMISQHFYPAAYTPAYGYLIAKRLETQGLVISSRGKGYRLLKTQQEIRIGDIVPVVSTRCRTLAKILLLAYDKPVTTLFT